MNPYKILNVDIRTDKKEIIQAAAKALRERKYSGTEIAVAQKLLLSPATRHLLDFVCFIDLEPIRNSLIPLNLQIPRVNETDLTRLSIFDDSEEI